MYSYSDFERLFIRYQAEAVPAGETLMKFCMRNKVPYNLLEKWYRDTRHKVFAVKVNGQPDDSSPNSLELGDAENASEPFYLQNYIIVNGSGDYENLLPATIGINQNKILKTSSVLAYSSVNYHKSVRF